jgi:hypothetical protein
MRKMFQLKLMCLWAGALCLASVVGLAGVSAQSAGALSTRPADAKEAPIAPKAALQTAQTTAIKPGDKMICKVEPILGTRLKGLRTCRTASEWRRISRGFQQKYKDLNDKAGAAFSGS